MNSTKENLEIFNSIIYLLDNEGFEYQLMEHEFVHRSEDAAKIRGTNLNEAVKALILKTKSGKIFMACINGDKRLDLKKLKSLMSEKNLSLASPEEVTETTRLVIGQVPPFPGLFSVEGYADSGIFENEYLVFSAGSHYKSIRMKSQDWKMIAGVSVEDIEKVNY